MELKLNENFKKLSENYLFSEISARVGAYRTANPTAEIISLGIGDVTRPLAPSVVSALVGAARNMSDEDAFCGYGDTLGLPSLRLAISERYKSRSISLLPDEIFINDGAKSDLANIQDVLGDNDILITDPVYPVYADASIISGKRIRFLRACEENGFLPSTDGLEKRPFVIYLCSPNNPTGACFSLAELQKWVDFALSSGSLIIFDAAYEAYITEPDLPHSIFEADGAENCAIEICSFSKMSGFTGIRCGWTAIPRANAIHKLWRRRQTTKFNGASYISQTGALAALSPSGEAEGRENIAYYMENALLISKVLKDKGIFFTGGKNAPYLWLKCPFGYSSWQFFDYLLKKSGVIGTPGVGFGKCGEGFFRLSSFASRANVLRAANALLYAL